MKNLVFSEKQLDACGIRQGLSYLAADYDFSLCGSGVAVTLRDTGDDTLTVEKHGSTATIAYDFRRKNLFFRGLGLLLERWAEDFSVTEEAFFTLLGSFLDLCQGNQTLTVDTMKTVLRRQAVMGLNACFLYMEDTYPIPDYPYFGFMRSKYTQAELKELDDYGDALGIELIPAIQGLSHLTTVVHWDAFLPMRENHRTLLPGAEETYDFLRQSILAASAPFRSRRIDLCMDECEHLGRGGYYQLHGDVPSEKIMQAHVRRVCAITEELGLHPILSDDRHFTKVDKSCFPKDLKRMYYSYSNHEPEWYENRFERRGCDRGDLQFCAAVWTYLSFAPNWALTVANLKCLPACRSKNIREVVESVWEIGQDTDFRLNYLGLQLFAEVAYGHTTEDAKKRFAFCCGGDAEGLWLLHEFDNVPSVPDGNLLDHPSAATEFLMFQDPMAGMFDFDIDGLPLNAHFAALKEQLKPYAEAARGTDWEDVYEYYLLLADVLMLKSELGLNITKAYREGDRAALETLAGETIPETARRVDALRKKARSNWMKLGKPLGWEVYDIRYGGVLTRLDSAAEAIRDYLSGRRARLEELEEPRQSYFRGGMGYAGRIPAWTDKWGRLVSASHVGQEYWLRLPQPPKEK